MTSSSGPEHHAWYVIRLLPLSCSEEEKLSTSQDAACKDAEESPEPAEAKCAAPRAPSSSPEQR